MIRRRHCAVAHEDDVLQRQKARQAGMIAEGRALGRVGRAVASAARQHVKPHWQASIASSQGKQLQLLQPLPRWVVPRLQARPSFHGRLRRKQTRKSHGHGVRLETMQVELIVLGGIGDQIAPDDRPLVVEGVQRPTRLVIVHLPRPLDLGIQRRNGKAFGPTRQVIQGGWVTEPGLGDPFCHQAVIQLRLLSDRTMTMHNLSDPQTPQHRHGEHQRAHRPSLAFHLMQLYSHGSTSISTGNCMLPFYCSSNPMQEVRNTSLRRFSSHKTAADIVQWDYGSWPDGLPKKDGAHARSGAGSLDTATTCLSKTSRTKNFIIEYLMVVWALLWLFFLLHVAWPSQGGVTLQRPGEPEPIKPRRTRSKEPPPFVGLTH